MIFVTIFFQGLIIGIFCQSLANAKGYSSTGWFFLGLFFSVIALIAIAGMPNKTNEEILRLLQDNFEYKKQYKDKNKSKLEEINYEQKHWECPQCKRKNIYFATKCIYCGYDLEQ